MVLLSIIRVIFYLYLGIQCLLISYLYREGSLRFNPNSLIIYFLQKTFFLIGVQFLFMAFIPILLELNKNAHAIAVNLLVIPMAALSYALEKFKSESVKKK